jgi:acyl carrier protein
MVLIQENTLTIQDLTNSGKDKLSKPTHARPELRTAYEKPRNSLEQTLTDIWQQLLGIESIGIHDDFFELGGDSLLGTRVISKVREVFRIGLPIQVLFEQSTVADIAKYMQNLPILSNEDKVKRVEEEI